MHYSSPDTKVLAALESVYRVFSDTSQYPSAMRCAAANRVLLTMMRSCSTKTLKAFFVNHVVDLMSLIEAKESKVIFFTAFVITYVIFLSYI